MKDINTIKWIFNKTKSQFVNFILVNVINIVYSFLSIYLILVSKNLIDSATSGDVLRLKKYLFELIFISLIEIALKAILASINAVTRAKLEINFKQDVLKTILERNYEQVSKLHSGELMTRIVSDVNIIIDTILSLIPYILSLLTRLICAVVLLFQISKQFVAILLIGGLVLFVVVNIFKPYIKNIHKKVQEAGSNVRLFFKEIFDNLIVIKIFEAEDVILDKSKQLQDKRYEIYMKRRTLSIASSTGFNTIYQIVYLFALVWSANNLYLGKITVGGLTSIVQLINQVQSPLIGLSKSFQNVFTMIGSAERIIELENIKADIDEENQVNCKTEEMYENMESLEVENVDFTYKNKHVLKNANLSVKKGEIVAIYGESGVGKSTLLKLILGIIEKDSGNIYFKCRKSVENFAKQNFTRINPRNKEEVFQNEESVENFAKQNFTRINPENKEENTSISSSRIEDEVKIISSSKNRNIIQSLQVEKNKNQENSLIDSEDEMCVLKFPISKHTRGMFTYVPQGKFIISGNIRENLILVNPDVSEDELKNALDVSMCTSFVDNLPDGLDTKIGERGSGLSEGQLQRLSLARAIVSGAPVLILDEVTSSLDSNTEAQVLKNIKNLKNRTCIIVTHRTSISDICDREFLLENFKISEIEK